LRQFDRAIQDYDQALRIDPNYATAISNRELARRALTQTDVLVR
jgi:tetratricopeptide (TPR) repeat protein